MPQSKLTITILMAGGSQEACRHALVCGARTLHADRGAGERHVEPGHAVLPAAVRPPALRRLFQCQEVAHGRHDGHPFGGCQV